MFGALRTVARQSAVTRVGGLRLLSTFDGQPLRGSVKWFDMKKGYGFIVSQDSASKKETDVFVHFSDIVQKDNEFRTLVDNEPVEFILVQENGKPKASAVKRLQPPVQQFKRREFDDRND